MNSYIKLKNGLIINLSQIEAIGPVLPFNMTYRGIYAGEDKYDSDNGKFDLGDKFYDNDYELSSKIFCVPRDCKKNRIYYNDEECLYPQEYMILLKSGRIILLTEVEYDDINNVMGLSNKDYSNVDMIYSKID